MPTETNIIEKDYSGIKQSLSMCANRIDDYKQTLKNFTAHLPLFQSVSGTEIFPLKEDFSKLQQLYFQLRKIPGIKVSTDDSGKDFTFYKIFDI